MSLLGTVSAWLAAVPGALDPAGASAMAAVIVTAVALLLAARLLGALPPRPVPVPIRRTRTAAHHRATVRAIDPDAAGRPRPRAPGRRPAA